MRVPTCECWSTRSGRTDRIHALAAGLGKTHCALYKYPQAEDFYGRAYAIQSDALGSEHPEVLRTMTAHASVLLILGRFSHAEEVYRTVLDMRYGHFSRHRSH